MTVRDLGEAWDANKKVLIPIGSLVSILAVTVFATRFYLTVEQMAHDISEMKEQNKTYVTDTELEARFLLHNLRYHRDSVADGGAG